MYYVYVYRSLFGDYVGSTKHPYLRREYGYSGKFHEALCLHGWKSFRRTLICETAFKDVALLVEDYFIRKYDTVRCGFNSRYNFKKKPTREEYEDAFGNISFDKTRYLNKIMKNPIYPPESQWHLIDWAVWREEEWEKSNG